MQKKQEVSHGHKLGKNLDKYQSHLRAYLNTHPSLNEKKVLKYLEDIPELCIGNDLDASLKLIDLLIKSKSQTALVAAFKKFPEEEQLLIAAAFGWNDFLELLLKKGISPNTQAHNGASALYLAAQNGHERAVQLLLFSGAKVDIKTDLYRLIAAGEHAAVENKIVEGMDPSITTPLCAATRGRHHRVMKLLLETGADPHALSTYGFALSKYSYGSTIILNSEEVRLGKHPYTPIHIAALNNDIAALKLLRQHSGNLEFSAQFPNYSISATCMGGDSNFTASTPFHAAVAANHLEAAGYLASMTKNVNQYACDKLPYIRADESVSDSKIGLTPIHFAAMTGNPLITKFLILNGVNVNAQGRRAMGHRNMYDPQTWSPLDFAMVYGQNQATVDELVKAGAKPNHWYSHMETAVENNEETVVKLLLSVTKSQHVHLSQYLPRAVEMNSLEVATLLINHGAKVTDELIKKAEVCKYDEMGKLLTEHKQKTMTFKAKVKRFFSCIPDGAGDVVRDDLPTLKTG